MPRNKWFKGNQLVLEAMIYDKLERLMMEDNEEAGNNEAFRKSLYQIADITFASTDIEETNVLRKMIDIETTLYHDRKKLPLCEGKKAEKLAKNITKLEEKYNKLKGDFDKIYNSTT